MKKLLAACAPLAVAAALFAGRAQAILGGHPDGDQHPYVGALAFYDDADTLLGTCTGALVSPTIVLTAGHCTSAGGWSGTPVHAQLWLDQGPIPHPNFHGGSCSGIEGFPCQGGDSSGTPVAEEPFAWPDDSALPTSADIGVVVLDTPVHLRKYAVLAPEGAIDTLAGLTRPRGHAKGVGFTIVGYGVTQVDADGSGRVEPFQRMEGRSSLVAVDTDATGPDFVELTNEPGPAAAGICDGDSGGPVLVGDVVVAVTSFTDDADGYCLGDQFDYRTDTESSLGFLARYGVQPPPGLGYLQRLLEHPPHARGGGRHGHFHDRWDGSGHGQGSGHGSDHGHGSDRDHGSGHGHGSGR